MSECISEECLARYLRGLLSENRRRRVEAHVAECPTCRQAAETARASRPAARTPDSAEDRDDSAKIVDSNSQEDRGASSGRLPQVSACSSGSRSTDQPLVVMFDDYQVIQELPPGGQAIVYKAIHAPTKSKVVLKVLLPALLGSPKARWQFEREVELAASLRHPNIVSIRDSGISRGQYYFSMEYIHGEHLDRYVTTRSLSLRDKVVLFGKLCEAMTHAHQRGVIHRDLKPSNVLVDERSEPHVLDFGLAKAAGSYLSAESNAMMLSMTGQLKGTLSYMSPEQAAGRTDLIDVRTDVYSLGVILYQMLVGRFPYDVSGSNSEVLQNIQEVEPTRPRHLISRFDSDIETILLKALAKDREHRYQSAAELHHDVRCWLEGLPIVAKSVSSLYLLRKVMARHRYTSTVVGLLAVILLSFVFVCVFLYNQLQMEQVARHQAGVAQTNAETLATGLARQATFLHVLDLWQRDQSPPARSIGMLGSNTREVVARRFLADPSPLSEKMAGFQRELKDEPFFAQFVIAEHLLKNGNVQEALQCYNDCRLMAADPVEDSLIATRIRIKMYDLSRGNVDAQAPR